MYTMERVRNNLPQDVMTYKGVQYPEVITSLDTRWLCDYVQRTTFWDDFKIADSFGIKGVKDTFKIAFKEWRENVVYLSELALVMYWKLSEHYQKRNDDFYELYKKQYQMILRWGEQKLLGEDYEYFKNTLECKKRKHR